jgi:uncharacterized protein (DUF433 family)
MSTEEILEDYEDLEQEDALRWFLTFRRVNSAYLLLHNFT